ncbi:MAG: flagellar basal body-associated FliL family protein [Alphaproteobacteria bacterium]
MADDKKKDAPKKDDPKKEASKSAPAEGEEGVDGEAPKKKNHLLLIVIVGGILIGGGIAAAVLLLLGGEEDPVEAEHVEVAAPVTPPEIENIAFYDVPPMTVDLMTDGRSSRFLKMKIALELDAKSDLTNMEKIVPRVQDDMQNFLRTMRVEDVKGTAGLQRLKEGLLLRAKQSAAPVPIRNVLFKELLVQ